MSSRGSSSALAAFVLHHYAWSESSLIVDLFTRELGRVAVAAKGAKRPYSQLRAVLLPFQRLNASLGRASADANNEVHNLRSAEWAGGVPMRGGDALFSGFYLNELLQGLLARQDPHPALWDAYAATLAWLGSADESAALRAFELVLLREIGLLPELSHVTATQAVVLPEGRYALRPEAGVVSAAPGDAAAVTGADLLTLQSALADKQLDALRQACAPPATALRRQLRALLHYHLGRPHLRTRQVLVDLQHLSQRP